MRRLLLLTVPSLVIDVLAVLSRGYPTTNGDGGIFLSVRRLAPETPLPPGLIGVGVLLAVWYVLMVTQVPGVASNQGFVPGQFLDHPESENRLLGRVMHHVQTDQSRVQIPVGVD